MLTKITKNSPQNGSETLLQTKEKSIEIPKERYVSPEEGKQIKNVLKWV